ncbi:MAG: L,D-transpeptidase [Paracoccaceae bacterium]|nr:L,D-transpeptidase [Paracoccaceae bacterium]
MTQKISRRVFTKSVIAGAATLSFSQPLLAQTIIEDEKLGEGVVRNISSFKAQNWFEHFEHLEDGAILCDTTSRAIHFWSEDKETYKIYPTSVPISEELTKLGRTKIVRKVTGPSWRPTPSMLKSNPEWPEFVPPGPDNPLGTHALYLSWQYYRIHGTHDTRKIGRRSSNGCIGLYNEHIRELFSLVKIGTQVLLI